MAGPASPTTVRRAGRTARLLGSTLAIFLLGVPFAGALAQTNDPRPGDAVPFYGPEGTAVATISVEEIVDPFPDYDANSAPDRGSHYVLLRLAVDNTGPRPLLFDPATVALQDTLGFLAFPQYVGRLPEATAAAPDLTYGEVAPDAATAGVVVFQVINGAELARVVYLPARERLVVLADLGGTAADVSVAGTVPAPTPAIAVPDASIVIGTATPVPAAPQATPVASAPTVGSGTQAASTGPSAVFENAKLGFRLAYDGGVWEATESPDSLLLGNGVSTVQVSGSDVLPGDARVCVEAVAADLELTSSRQNYRLLQTRAGEPFTGGGPAAAFAIYGYTNPNGDAAFEQITCIAIPEERGVVLFLHNGPQSTIEQEIPAGDALLDGLAFA